MSLHPILPQEIIDEIIEDVSYPDAEYATLTACSLVSSSFRDTAQKVLFRGITISLSRPDTTRYTVPASVLTSSRRLCNLVEYINVFINSPDAKWDIFPLLPRLQRLSIQPGKSWATRWSDLPDTFTCNLYDMFRWPSLRSLNISFITDFPIFSICASRQLTTLGITHVTFDTQPNTTAFATAPQPVAECAVHERGYLQSLSIYGFRDTIRTLQSTLSDPSSHLSISRLRKLSIDGSSESAAIFYEVIGTTTSHLEDLELGMMIDAPDLALVLPHLPRLRHIRFIPRDLLQLIHIERILALFPDTHNLSQVSINGTSELCVPDHEDGTTVGVWQALDSLLTRECHATEFKELSISIRMLTDMGECLRVFFETSMPQLLAESRLVVTVSYYPPAGPMREYSIIPFATC